MSKATFVADLTAGDTVDALFVAKNKRLADFRNKPGQYLSMTLCDKTGEVDARAWDNGPALANRFNDGDVVRVQGKVELYNNARQVIVSTVLKCRGDEYDLTDFVPTTDKDMRALLTEIEQTIAGISDPHLKQLLESFFHDAHFVDEFTQAPAATRQHHAYLGGLAEHVVNVLHLARAVLALYPETDADLLLTGVILHDIGKLRELKADTLVDYTDEGKLIGHVAIGAMMIEEKMRAIEGFPNDLRMRVTHMILSHHGEYLYGAPVLPKTAEALALHLLENLDAQINHFFSMVSAVKDPGALWTDWDRKWERQLYTGRGALGAEAEAPKETSASLFE